MPQSQNAGPERGTMNMHTDAGTASVVADPAVQRLSMPHVPALDGLRALAICIVFVSHSGLGSVVPGGLGVTIFFFLSGFLITSLLRVEFAGAGTISFFGFYMRRVFRIMPPLWLTMVFVAVLVATGLMAADPDPIGVAAQALFATNYAELWYGRLGLPGMPLWSLAVEEHFYFLFPLLFLFLMKTSTARRTAVWCGILCGVVLMLRMVHVFVWNDLYQPYYLTHTRIDSILFGCILALWQNPVLEEKAWKPGPLWVAVALGALLMTLAIRQPQFRETVRYTIQGISLFVLFSAALWARGPVRTVLANPVLKRIGLYSYTIYLVHFAIIHLIAENLTHGSMLLAGIIAILPTWGYAALMYRVVERPLGRWRRRLDLFETAPPVGQTSRPVGSV